MLRVSAPALIRVGSARVRGPGVAGAGDTGVKDTAPTPKVGDLCGMGKPKGRGDCASQGPAMCRSRTAGQWEKADRAGHRLQPSKEGGLRSAVIARH